MLSAHETKAALAGITKRRHGIWSQRVRSELEQKLNYLRLDADTDEERRDVQRLWDLMNDVCAKHARRAGR